MQILMPLLPTDGDDDGYMILMMMLLLMNKAVAYDWHAWNLNWPIRVQQLGKNFTVLTST